MNVEQVKAKFLKEFQEEQVAVNFGHAALAADLSEEDDDKEEIIEFLLKSSVILERRHLETKTLEELRELRDLYYV